MEDPDAPVARPFLQFLVLGLPASGELPEAALSSGIPLPLGRLGQNDFRKLTYAGPRSLPGHGTHRYFLQAFALSQALPQDVVTRDQFANAAKGLVVGRWRLVVNFSR